MGDTSYNGEHLLPSFLVLILVIDETLAHLGPYIQKVKARKPWPHQRVRIMVATKLRYSFASGSSSGITGGGRACMLSGSSSGNGTRIHIKVLFEYNYAAFIRGCC